MDTIIIRFARASDFDTVYQFINELENEEFDKITQHQIYTANCTHQNHIYLIAIRNDFPIGFLSCHVQQLLHHGGAIGEIQELFVAADYRSSGAGKLLINELKRIAKERNILQLEVTSSFKREAAHRFYERETFDFTHKKFVFKI